VDYSSTDYARVQIMAVNLPILKGSIYPQTLSLWDQAYFPYIKRGPNGWFGYTANAGAGTGMGLYYPSFGAGPGTPPPTSTPIGADNTFTESAYADASSAVVGGPTMAGTYQNWDAGGPFVGYY
jgi:hypothetical protein